MHEQVLAITLGGRRSSHFFSWFCLGVMRRTAQYSKPPLQRTQKVQTNNELRYKGVELAVRSLVRHSLRHYRCT